MHHPPSAPAPHQTASTLLESFDSWAQLLRHGPAAAVGPIASPSRPPTLPEAEPYRPTLRHPLALLHVVDDGRDDGETIRLREDRLTIGRTEGDVTVPHDISMSPTHAALERLADGTWQLADLGSAGGTFIRVVAARLHHGSCLWLGATRLRFDLADEAAPCLVETTAAGDGRRHACRTGLTTIGRRGGGCDLVLDDRFVSPLHAELHHTASGWRIENRGLNGLWVRLEAPVRLTCPSQFQCGEQRFVFVPLVP